MTNSFDILDSLNIFLEILDSLEIFDNCDILDSCDNPRQSRDFRDSGHFLGLFLKISGITSGQL